MKRILVAALSILSVAALFVSGVDAAMQIRKKADGDAGAASAPPPAAAAAPAAAPVPAPAPAPKAEAVKSETPAAKSEAPAAKAEAPAAKAEAPKAAPKAAAPVSPAKPESFIGAVSLIQGKKALVESSAELSPKQRLIAYDERLVKKGSLKITSNKGRGVYLASLTSGNVSGGDRLVKESEEEAFVRVSRSRNPAVVKEFIELYPDSPHRMDISLRLFRLALRSDFPAASDSSRVTGRISLVEKVGQKIELGRAMIKLDRFLIAMTDEEGRFAIDGIPQLVLPVKVPLAVADAKFQSIGELFVDFPAEKSVTVEQDLQVALVPTVLSGKVVDDKGMPLRGVQVWTSPYTMEKLTDENGEYSISRKKKLDDSGNPLEGDEPLLGRDYEVFAYKAGFNAEKISVSAASFKENEVKPLPLSRQGSIEATLPAPQVGLRENLDLMQYVVSAGAGPKINR